MTPEPPMIRAEGLVKRYGELVAVDGASFSIARGEIVGFLGPNGAGKTTTMRMLVGALHPDHGSASIAGHDLASDPLEARRRVGYLPEHTPLYREMRVDRYLGFVATVRGFGARARRAAVERVLHAADLEDHAGRRIRTLSKGYRQRVGLAQALVPDPDVLVLDEPTSGLDPAEIVRIRERIVALAETKTVLLSTHVLPEVEEVCRRAIIIAAGRIVADGPLAELGAEEAPALVVTLETDAPREEVHTVLAEVPGVGVVETRGGASPGRLRVRLEVQGDRWEVARGVTALAASRGWAPVELSHEVPTLERVFLSRTRGLSRRTTGQGGGNGAGNGSTG